jgi:hypothetical protein
MKLQKFKIITHNESQQIDEKTSILLNTEHIISVKPIKLTTVERQVIDGYWIRLSNGKKYKAIQVPEMIKKLFSEQLPKVAINEDNMHEISLQ